MNRKGVSFLKPKKSSQRCVNAKETQCVSHGPTQAHEGKIYVNFFIFMHFILGEETLFVVVVVFFDTVIST